MMKLNTLRVAPAERLPSDPSNPRLGAGAFIQCLGRSEREALVPSSRGADSSPWGDTETWSRVGAFKPETLGRQFSRLDEVFTGFHSGWNFPWPAKEAQSLGASNKGSRKS